jgi:hypothetical protein
MNLIDPRRHAHIGIPYDFHSGYLLMVANNIDIDSENVVNSGSSYGSRRGSNQPVAQLYGQLPTAAIRELQTTHRSRFTQVFTRFLIFELKESLSEIKPPLYIGVFTKYSINFDVI